MYIFFQNIKSNLKKEPLVTILFLIQLAVTAFAIFVTCFEVKYESDRMKSVNNSLVESRIYNFNTNYEILNPLTLWVGENTDGYCEIADKCIEEIKEIDGVELVHNNYSAALWVQDPCLFMREEDRNSNKNSNSLLHSSETVTNTSQWRRVQIDKSFFEKFPFKLDSGRMFTDEEWEADYAALGKVPALLGSRFKEYCKIGDTFEASFGNDYISYNFLNFEVIGFIEEDEVFPDNTGSTLETYNDKIVVPIPICNYYDERYFFYGSDNIPKNREWGEMWYSSYLIVERENEQEIIDQIYGIYEKYGVKDVFTLGKYKGDTAAVSNNYKESMFIRLVLTYITVFFSFVSIALITVNRISSNIRNYAIHLISGGTFHNIYMFIIGEIVFYSVIGFALGFAGYYIRNFYLNYIRNMTYEHIFGIRLGWFICVLMLILFVIISLLIIINRMKKTDLSSALRDKLSSGNRGTIYKVVTVAAFAVISVCIIFAVSYLVFLNKIDMYYRHFYTANTNLITVNNDPNIDSNVKISTDYKNLGDNYVVDKFLSTSYSDVKPYIRATYYKGDVALPEIRHGRYFTEEELDNKVPKYVAVIGQTAYDDFAVVREDGSSYFEYLGKQFEIIGIIGRLDGTTTKIDEWVIVPLNTYMLTFKEPKGNYFIDGPTKADIEKASETFIANIENEARYTINDQEFSAIVVGPTDALITLAVMIGLNIIIICIYYTDKKQYTIGVKKFLGYSRKMIFIDLFAGFFFRASIGFAIGMTIIFAVISSPLSDSLMFRALSLNIPTVIFSFGCTVLLTFIFAMISINRMFNRDTSEVIRS